jgi:transcriptional regulator with XRE-family HTH domain
MSDDSPSPAVEGRVLRAALRQARNSVGLTREQVAAELDVSLSKVVRIESGAVKVSTTDLKALLELYKITDQGRIDELVAMAKVARQQPSWWRAYRDIASKNYLEFVEFEQAATATLNYEPLWVPGLLQTRDYAAEIIRQLGPESDEAQQGLFDFRMKRQELLDATDLPSLSFVLDESVLHRRVGSEDVMVAQLGRLTELAGSSVTIQVRPFSNGLVRHMAAPFVIHQLTDAADLDVLYLEGPVGDTVVADDKDEISRFRSAFEELKRTSLSPSESVKFFKELADSFH